MNAEERTALHRRLATGLVDAYRSAVGQGEVVYPAEWKLAEDMVLWSPGLTGGADFPYAKTISAVGLSVSQAATLELQWLQSKLPDFGPKGPAGRIVATDTGWAMWWSFEGTAADGTVYRAHEADFITTNSRGEIERWESFLDWAELGPLVALVSGRHYPDGIAIEEYLGLIGEFHAQRAANGSKGNA